MGIFPPPDDLDLFSRIELWQHDSLGARAEAAIREDAVPSTSWARGSSPLPESAEEPPKMTAQQMYERGAKIHGERRKNLELRGAVDDMLEWGGQSDRFERLHLQFVESLREVFAKISDESASQAMTVRNLEAKAAVLAHELELANERWRFWRERAMKME